MDYTIDPDEAVDALLAQHARQANLDAMFGKLDAAAMEFCEIIRALDGKEPDPKMAIQTGVQTVMVDGAPVQVPVIAEWGDHKAAVEANAAEAEAKCADRVARMAKPLTPDVLEADRVAKLAEMTPAWEAEHAQHGLHIELAESPEQVESSTISQLYIEGKILAARKLDEAQPEG